MLKQELNLNQLEVLENELSSASAQIDEIKKDEDRLLEQENLNDLERRSKAISKNDFEPLNDIEKKEGKKYVDGVINTQFNPYGLSENDIEEMDELINTASKRSEELWILDRL